jgi:GTPase SAR1 family protein
VSTNPSHWIQIWDTPGQEKYRMMPQAIIHNFDFALVFYDVTSMHTFKVAEQILKSKRENNLDISMYNPNI